MPKDVVKGVIFGDVHAPYHDRRAVSCMLNAMAYFKPDFVVGVGDLFDFYACSFYTHDPKRWRRLGDELERAMCVRGDIESAAGGADLTIVLGNHEDRLERYIHNHAPALDGIVDLETALGLSKWQIVPYSDFIKIGKVLYTHDLDYSGPYFARRALQDAGHSVVIGHVHRAGMAVEGDIAGKHRVGWSFGWLGDAQKANYKHRLKAAREWSHGFGLAYMRTDGVTWFTHVPIINGSCVVEGKMIGG